MACTHCEHLGREALNRWSVETSAKRASASKWTVISNDGGERNMILTEGGVSSSLPRLLTERICVGVAGTVAETDKRFGEGSVSTSTGG